MEISPYLNCEYVSASCKIAAPGIRSTEPFSADVMDQSGYVHIRHAQSSHTGITPCYVGAPLPHGNHMASCGGPSPSWKSCSIMWGPLSHVCVPVCPTSPLLGTGKGETGLQRVWTSLFPPTKGGSMYWQSLLCMPHCYWAIVSMTIVMCSFPLKIGLPDYCPQNALRSSPSRKHKIKT